MALYLPFEELLTLVKNTELTYNPLDDMYKITKLGNIIYESNKHHQWKESVDLYNCIVEELAKHIPEFSYSKEDFKLVIECFVKDNVYPNGTKNDLLDYFRNIYVSKTGFNFSTSSTEDILNGRNYLDFMNSLRYVIDKVYSKYIYKWDEIDATFNTIHDLIEDKFGHVENQEEYVNFTKKIFGLMDEVDELVRQFYKYKSEYIDKGYLERDYKMCFNVVMSKNKVDEETEKLLQSTVYVTNLQLHKLNLNLKISEQKLANLVL
jgi:hypothetical protein